MWRTLWEGNSNGTVIFCCSSSGGEETITFVSRHGIILPLFCLSLGWAEKQWIVSLSDQGVAANLHYIGVHGSAKARKWGAESRIAGNSTEGIRADLYNSTASKWYCKWWYDIWENPVVARTAPVAGTSPAPSFLKCKESRLFAWFLLDDQVTIEIEGYFK